MLNEAGNHTAQNTGLPVSPVRNAADVSQVTHYEAQFEPKREHTRTIK